LFVFRLAKELGKTVKQLACELGDGELDYWRAYYGVEPFGERPADLRAGIVAATVANFACVDSDFKPSDFMVPVATLEDDSEPDQDELTGKLLKWAGAVNSNSRAVD
jgi:hypothetical protein